MGGGYWREREERWGQLLEEVEWGYHILCVFAVRGRLIFDVLCFRCEGICPRGVCSELFSPDF